MHAQNAIADSPPPSKPARGLVAVIVALFFAWGFCTVLVDTLIPKLKGLFSLSYAEVMLTQFAFFLAYFVMSLPCGFLLSRLGYLRSIAVGLLVMAIGCLVITPAARLGLYGLFLVALFVLASGITLLQVAANPLIAKLGDAAHTHVRLNLAQAFNSLGTAVGPLLGAAFILAGGVALPGDPLALAPEALAALRRQEAAVVQGPFIAIAAALCLFAVVVWVLRNRQGLPLVPRGVGMAHMFAPLRHRRLAMATLSLFLYVGAEVSIGSLMVSYLMLDSTVAISAQSAGKLVSLYWGGAMVGRFVGSMLMRRIPAATVLCACALGAAMLVGLSSLSSGTVAAVAIIAVGLCNSVMFPTIFSLGIEHLGHEVPQGSALLCLAIVGGAVVPLITGVTADFFGLATALIVPGACYLVIASFSALIRAGALDR